MNDDRYLLDFYNREVLTKLLPNFRFDENAEIWSIAGAEGDRNVSLPSSYFNKCLLNSPYNLDKTSSFIHYTSLSSLISILNESKLRLGPATLMNDPLELSFAKNYLGEITSGGFDYIIDEDDDRELDEDYFLKRSTFLLSMSEVESESSPDSFDMWRMYGQSGDGVALILNIDNIHRPDWFNCHLSKVHYGENEEIISLKQFIKKHENFLKSNNVVFSNFYSFLRPIFALHKSELYSNEKEVRLLIKTPHIYFSDSLESEFNEAVSFVKFLSNGKIATGLTLRLRNQYNFKRYKHLDWKHIPAISIEKVILGYKYSERQLKDIKKTLDFISATQDTPQIPVEITKLKDVLGFK